MTYTKKCKQRKSQRVTLDYHHYAHKDAMNWHQIEGIRSRHNHGCIDTILTAARRLLMCCPAHVVYTSSCANQA